MATTTRPDQDKEQNLHPSEGDFAQWERELHHPGTDSLPTADQSGVDAEEQSIQRAKRLLREEQPLLGRNSDDLQKTRELELNPDAPKAPENSIADQEARPRNPIRAKGYDGKKTGSFFKRMAKRRAQIMAGIAIIGVLVGGATAVFQAVSDLPRNLATQASRVVKARVSAYFRERIKPYLLQYLIGQVLLNRVGIEDCKDDLNPGPIVTKDCFYRHTKKYPRTFVGKAWQGWKDGRMEARLAAHGVEINYLPNAIIDPSTGRRGERWIITTSAGEMQVDPGDPEPQMRLLFETHFDDPSNEGRAAILAHIMEAVSKSSHSEEVLTMGQRRHLWRKYAIRGCNFYCKANQRIEKVKATPTAFRNYLFGLVVKAVAPGPATSIAIGCFLSREYECQESDPKFRAKYEAEINEIRQREGGADRLKELFDKANAAKLRSGKRLDEFITKFILIKLTNKFAPSVASAVLGQIPYIGIVFSTISFGLTTINVLIIYHAMSEVLAGPAGQLLRTMVRAEGFSGLWHILRQASDERNAAKQVYDLNADSAYNNLLKGYEQSFLWQSQYGNKENFKDYAFLFPKEAHAASLDAYPYTCNADGDKIPAGQLVCPQWKFTYKPPIAEALAGIQTKGNVNEILDDITAVGNDISDTIGAPFEAISEPILETQPAKDAMELIQKATKPLTDVAVKEILAPPFDSYEDVKGAKFLDGAWAGVDWLTNDEIRGGVSADGTQHGWARVLTDQEVKTQESAVVASIRQEFAGLSLWDRIFSTQYTQSFMSQLAYAAPSGIHTPVELASSLFNPSLGLRFAAINQSVQAAPANPHPFGNPQYGVGGELQTTPARSVDDATPCPQDRTPIDLDTPGAIDRGLGRAEYPTVNMCSFDQDTLFIHSAYF
ncbi:MAG TPA: hypothetical protein VFT87_00070, partial [Candidatus Saccharimonadales bacterium]|nr:hypothetical protein [Candidatus Saccharimonadales bacterium]